MQDWFLIIRSKILWLIVSLLNEYSTWNIYNSEKNIIIKKRVSSIRRLRHGSDKCTYLFTDTWWTLFTVWTQSSAWNVYTVTTRNVLIDSHDNYQAIEARDIFACSLRQGLRSTVDEATGRTTGGRPEPGRIPSGSARSSSFGESAVTATSSHPKVILTSRERGFQF